MFIMMQPLFRKQWSQQFELMITWVGLHVGHCIGYIHVYNNSFFLKLSIIPESTGKSFTDDSRLSKLVRRLTRDDDRDRRITAAKQLKEFLQQPENNKVCICWKCIMYECSFFTMFTVNILVTCLVYYLFPYF